MEDPDKTNDVSSSRDNKILLEMPEPMDKLGNYDVAHPNIQVNDSGYRTGFEQTGLKEEVKGEKEYDHMKSYVLAFMSMILFTMSNLILAQQGNSRGLNSIFPQCIAMCGSAVF